MPTGSIYESFLANQGLALFEYRGAGAFRAVGKRPRWCEEIWGRRMRNSQPAALAKSSPFLENFLGEAEPFWQSPTAAGCLNSGSWIERTKSGGEVPLEASALFLGGHPILLLRNLSATFAAQQELFQTAREALLQHERLEREIQKKEILLHCIVHDLSQPLTAMRGCFDLLSVENLPMSVTRYVAIGHRESQRQEHMIRGILEAFAADLHAASVAHSDEHEPPDILACARQAVQAFAPAFEERGIHLQLDLPAEDARPLHVAGDAQHLDRIFGNFLENALRYSPQGSTVTLGVRNEPDSAVLAFVDDQGPGLPADVPANQIFALFSKGKDRPGKAGLGLYFCKITVERWGGTVGAETRSSGGARFWLRIPGAHSAEPQCSQESEQISAKEAEHMQDDSGPMAAAGKKLRILVAEDTDVNRELLVELLNARGHSVTATIDGREALTQFEKHDCDVVILDQEMPRMNGIEAARAIRLAEFASAKKRARIIGLSGNASEEDKKNALAAGMDAFLPKPFDRQILFQWIESGAPDARAGGPAEGADAAAGESAPQSAAAHLRRTTAGNEKLMQSLIATFLADAPQKLAAIVRAVARKDAEKLASAAHSFKGSLGIFGAERAAAAARSLEAMGRMRHLERSEQELAALTQEFAQLERELRALQPAPKVSAKPRAPLDNSRSKGRGKRPR